MKRSVTVSLGSFAREALSAAQMNGDETAASVVRAIRVYLNDKEAHEPGWAFPVPLREQHPAEEIELQLSVDESLWRDLESEAASQGVSAGQLLQHAVLYLTAEVDAGRATQRILDDLDEG